MIGLVVLLAFQLIPATIGSPGCLDLCPDVETSEECSPACALCVSCTNAQKALSVQPGVAPPADSTQAAVAPPRAPLSAGDTGEIAHVPLFG